MVCKNIFFTILLSLFLFPVFSQISIVGNIFDKETNLPIQFATVYINGTTKGTITDSTGHFTLEKLKPPCMLVLSCVGYQTYTTILDNKNYPKLTFQLQSIEVLLPEVFISDKNLRNINLDFFKSNFLGIDVWGKNATIENEDAIYFTKDFEPQEIEVKNKMLPVFLYEEKDKVHWSADSAAITYFKPMSIRAYAKEPLIIDVPLLGYRVYVDLIEFVNEYISKKDFDRCYYFGFYHFRQTETKSKRDSIRIHKNRLKAYYNSPQHFLRSLFEDRLLENGYNFLEMKINDSTNKRRIEPVNIDSLLIKDRDIAAIVGKEKGIYQISYYENYRGNPVNLKERNGYEPVISRIMFMNDTCVFRNDGTMPSVDILFGGALGNKKVGAMLPSDFYVEQ